MGFRNRLTSATTLDTRTTVGTPGVVTDQHTVDASLTTAASLALTDGFALDQNAGLYRTAAVNTNAQAQSKSGGLAVKGGSYAGVTAPELDLNVNALGGGGAEAEAVLRNLKRFRLDAAPVARALGGTVDAADLAAYLGTNLTGGTHDPDSQVPIVQAGTLVGTTTAAGAMTLTFPQAFPHTLVTVIGTPGDTVGSFGSVTFWQYGPGPTWSWANFNAYTPAGALIANTLVRLNWLAIGW